MSLQVRPVDVFLRAIAQKTWNHTRMCLFGVIKLAYLNLILNPYLSPKPSNVGPKRDSFFDQKCLTMGALKSKLPLIIIVAP